MPTSRRSPPLRMRLCFQVVIPAPRFRGDKLRGNDGYGMASAYPHAECRPLQADSVSRAGVPLRAQTEHPSQADSVQTPGIRIWTAGQRVLLYSSTNAKGGVNW